MTATDQPTDLKFVFSRGDEGIGDRDLTAMHGLTSRAILNALVETVNGGWALRARDWAGDTDFITGELVVDSGTLYRCVEDHTSTSVFDISKFSSLASGSAAVSSVDGATGAVDLSSTYIPQAGGATEKIVGPVSVSGTYLPDVSLGNAFDLELVGDLVIGVPTFDGDPVEEGNHYGILIYAKQGAGGPYSVTCGTGVTPFVGTQPITQTDEGEEDIFSLVCRGDPAAWMLLQHAAPLAIPGYLAVSPSSAPPTDLPLGVGYIWIDSTTQTLMLRGTDGVDRELGASTPAAGVITGVSGQETTKVDTVSGSFDIALPSTPASGNDVVVMFGTDVGAVTGPAGWTQDGMVTDALGVRGIWRLRSTGVVGDKTATFTFSGSHYCFATIKEYDGVLSPSPVDKTAANTSSGTNTVTITTAATTQASELALCVFRTGGFATLANWADSGFSTLFDGGAGGMGSKALSATGAVIAKPTMTGNISMGGLVVTYKAA